MNQASLFPNMEPPARFDGKTFDEKLDGERLTTLQDRVEAFMLDGIWRTLADVKKKCGGTEASVSARIRDLRKEKFGGHTVEHRRTTVPGVWEYRILKGSK